MASTSKIGEVSTAQVLAALVRQGKSVYLPFGDHKRCDFLMEDEGEQFYRVQCKTGHLINGAVLFYPCSVDSRSEKGRCIRKGYRGQIDLFGVYCPDNGRVYVVPIEDATDQQCSLRIEPTRNHQEKHIRWARDYEVGRIPKVGDLLDLSPAGSADTLSIM